LKRSFPVFSFQDGNLIPVRKGEKKGKIGKIVENNEKLKKKKEEKWNGRDTAGNEHFRSRF